MKNHHKDINPVEEEFSLLGFDYTAMITKAMFAGKNHLLFIDCTKMNTDTYRNFHDELQIELGVSCTISGKPLKIQSMTARLIRYTGSAYEGTDLDYRFYDKLKGLPTKNQITAEMQNVLSRPELNNTENVAHAKQVLSVIQEAEQKNFITLKKRL